MAVSNAVAKEKKYVGVAAYFSDRGGMRPMFILWEDGRKFPIDKVTEVKKMSGPAAGGNGLRYTCQIKGGTHSLYYEGNYKWFVEGG